MTTNRHFDLIAPLYERFIRAPEPQRLKRMLDLPSPGWVLDAAGGTGRVASLLADDVEHLALSDLSLPMLREAARKPGINPTSARAEQLPFADDFFTRIVVVDAFHHFGDQPAAIRDLARVLRPGGRLVIEEPDIRSFGVKLIALGETLVGMGSHFRSIAHTRRLLEANGLQTTVEALDATVWIIGIKPNPPIQEKEM